MTEAERIEAAFKAVDWPSFVKGREWKVDLDSTGDKAIWVWVIVPDPEEIEEDSPSWSLLPQAIREALAAKGLDLWAYVRVKAESEEPTKRR